MTLVYKLYVNVWFIVGVSHEEVTNLRKYVAILIVHVTKHKKCVTFVVEYVYQTSQSM